jgi:hypothetical protein
MWSGGYEAACIHVLDQHAWALQYANTPRLSAVGLMGFWQRLFGRQTLREYMASIEQTSTFTTSDGKTHTARYYGDTKSHRAWNRKNGFE